MTNAVFYVLETGCQWGQLPHDFSAYQIVYSFFRRAKVTDLWEKIMQYTVM
ncbi:MAG: transposase [Synergistaceae bacterium]|nr:transposase [Synergistaceae bacterium]